MRWILPMTAGLALPSVALADCVYTGAKRAYLECIYAEAAAATAQLVDVWFAIDDLDARVSANEGDLSFVDAALMTLSDGLDALSLAVDGLTGQVSGLDADVVDLQDQVAALSSGGGGGLGQCLTRYGKNTCPSGFSPVYTGHWAVLHRPATATMSNSVCVDDAGVNWVAGSTNFDITSRVNASTLETYDNTSGGQLSGCAVCCPTAGSASYTHWGEAGCASGYTQFSQGNAAVLANYGTGAGASSLMCMDDAGFTWTQGSTDWNWVSKACGSTNDCHDDTQSGLSACSVCYR
ncbi:MAG TPA: hypothetical protein PKA64_15595 [Myxococcota bacterium]|nr:hypothetical protein [Myxococcota bacterium]